MILKENKMIESQTWWSIVALKLCCVCTFNVLTFLFQGNNIAKFICCIGRLVTMFTYMHMTYCDCHNKKLIVYGTFLRCYPIEHTQSYTMRCSLKCRKTDFHRQFRFYFYFPQLLFILCASYEFKLCFSIF